MLTRWRELLRYPGNCIQSSTFEALYGVSSIDNTSSNHRSTDSRLPNFRIEEVNPTMNHRERCFFAGLPVELLLIVMKHLATRDLAALGGVTKQYNNICRPIIFRKVDLSIHNRGQVPCTFLNGYQCPPSRWFESSDSLRTYISDMNIPAGY